MRNQISYYGKNVLILGVLCMSFSACNGSSSVSVTPQLETAPITAGATETPPLGSATGGLTSSFDGARYFDQSQFDKLMQAKKLIEIVINSEAFKAAVLSFSYNGVNEFVQNNGMSNQQVYDNLMTGAEKYPVQTGEDHIMNFDIELYTSSWFGRGTLGYTDVNTKTIHVNTWFYNKAAVNEVAMNLVHEWTHKMGFDHDSARTARRDYSVPYGVGYLVRDLGKNIPVEQLQ